MNSCQASPYPAGGVRISVVIPTRDRVESLRKVLAAVSVQSVPPHQVVVVDDGSIDATPRFLAERSADVDVVRLHGVGVAAARNAGLAVASGRYVVFLDDDDRPCPTWLERLGEMAGPDVGIISCAVTIHSGGEQSTVRPPVGPWGVEPVMLAGAFAVRSDALSALGGYLEGLTYSENTELGMRLMPYCRDRGLLIRTTPEVLHEVFVADARRSTVGRAQATMLLIETHEHELRRHPDRLARWLCTAGVDFWRDGDHPSSRGVLRWALRVRPGDPRVWLRVIAAHVPPLGNHIWRAGAPGVTTESQLA